jgi:hypothetical protein
VLAGCASSGAREMSDWEKKHPELLAAPEAAGAPTPPPFPRSENLIEFYLSATATFRYFIDGSTLQTFYDKREVRYVIVARSPSGVENVRFEAIRCPDMFRTYAIGTSGGKWIVRPTDWEPTVRRSDLGWPSALARGFFCPHNDPIQSPAEGVVALRNGVHPQVWVDPSPVGGGAD